MGNIVSIVEALAGGYVIAVLLQIGLGYLITRQSRDVLMRGDSMSRAFHLQNGAAWVFSSAAAAALTLHFLPGTWIGPVIAGAVALLLILALLRNHLKMPRQQTATVMFGQFLCIALGSAASCLLLLKKG